MSVLPFEKPTDWAVNPPPDRGRLITAAEVVNKMGGGVKESWVRKNVPHKVVLGHRTVLWYEKDVDEWLESKRVA